MATWLTSIVDRNRVPFTLGRDFRMQNQVLHFYSAAVFDTGSRAPKQSGNVALRLAAWISQREMSDVPLRYFTVIHGFGNPLCKIVHS
ncbi:hypothetical protein FRACA_3110007 [Frankia canadensis]|uniref:Uncharacterized protein n=1 Tax=Frankia canadensis TaxID=1836972 RepID=A0A2I2KUC8_9ACTN|nr:hypothetical protein FRACA_3110007 [Frankia canadensis]SOU56549.1 hypothetical protein FRACA_3110007 [Frankia canadensis]